MYVSLLVIPYTLMNYEPMLCHIKAAIEFLRLLKVALFPSLFITSLSKEGGHGGNCTFRYLKFQP